MKTIKFRAWDPKTEECDDDGNVIRTGCMSVPYEMKDLLNLKYIDYTNGTYKDVYPEDEFVWLQYTGCMDTDGKEIYEGDICRIEQGAFKDDNNTIGVVEYHSGKFCRKIGEKRYHDLFPLLCTVIGNIYEHPEMIKQ